MNGSAVRGVDDVVRLESVRKVFGRKRNLTVALDGVTTGFRRGSFTAVMGPSGSGKSTLLQSAAGLDQPTSGAVILDGQPLQALSETALTRFRREHVGFVFQAFNLLPSLSVEENVTLPLRLAGRRPDRAAVDVAIERVGLGARRRHRPGELSGGQQQRVAIARALITAPAVLFADEPTGMLDSRASLEILGLLRETVRTTGQTVVMVTHDPVAAAYADRVVFLSDGRIVGAQEAPTATAITERMTRLGAWAEPALQGAS